MRGNISKLYRLQEKVRRDLNIGGLYAHLSIVPMFDSYYSFGGETLYYAYLRACFSTAANASQPNSQRCERRMERDGYAIFVTDIGILIFEKENEIT